MLDLEVRIKQNWKNIKNKIVKPKRQELSLPQRIYRKELSKRPNQTPPSDI